MYTNQFNKNSTTICSLRSSF